MADAQSQQQTTLLSELDRLSSEFGSTRGYTPEEAMDFACSRLAMIDPISSAGMFQFLQASTSLEWIHRSEPSVEVLEQPLINHGDGISKMLGGGDLVQISGGDSNHFVGLPAGHYNGSAIGLGISSARRLEQIELARLGTFGLLFGLIVENARLSQEIKRSDEASSTARIIGFIVHELRTPLTGMRGNIQLALMASKKGQHDRIPARLEAAISGVDDMSGLVQQLLDVSRLERGAYPLSLSEANVGDLISRAVERFRLQARHEQDSVVITGDTAINITVDRDALEKSIYLILKNINRYTDESSNMYVLVHRDNDVTGIDLSYSGRKCSSDDVSALSAPLSASSVDGVRNENLSLELAYCRGIVGQHEGWIDFQSDNTDSGKQVIQLRIPDHPGS